MNNKDFNRGPEKETCPDCGEPSCGGHREHFEECETCGGSGGFDASHDCEVYDDWQPCPDCEGLGEVFIA